MGIYKDQDGLFYVRPANIMKGKISIDGINELSANFWVSNVDVLKSSFLVMRNNSMAGRIDIVKNLIKKHTLYPKKDAFVRSSLPTFNYGDIQDLLIGKNSLNDIYRTFIEFDPNELPKNIEITKAYIRLTTSQFDNFIPGLKLYTASDNWYEYGITWANQPSLDELISEVKENIGGKKYVDIDITNIATEWYKGTFGKHGFVLVSNDENYSQYKRFYSKESFYKPQLIVEYYDLNPISYSGIYVNSTVRTLYPALHDIYARFEIFTYDRLFNLDSTLNVRISGQMPSRVFVSKSNLDGTLFVGDKLDIDSYFVTIENNANEISSVVRINNKELFSTTIVRRNQYKELINRLLVRQNKSKDLTSEFVALQPYLNSVVEVVNIKELLSTVYLHRNDWEDLYTKIGVKREEILSKIEVLWTNDIDALLQVKRNEYRDINSKIIAIRHNYNTLNSTIDVTNYEELDALVYVPHKDLISQVIVKKHVDRDLLSAIDVHYLIDYDATIYVTQRKDIDSKIEILIPFIKDIDTIINVREQNTILSRVFVNRSILFSSVTVRPMIFEDKDLNSIVRFTKDYMDSIIRISRDEIYATIKVEEGIIGYVFII